MGIIVLTNQESGAAFTAVSNTIEDHYLGMTGLDRVQEMVDRTKQRGEGDTKAVAAVWQQVAAAQKAAPKKPGFASLTGRYHDAWLGDVNIYAQGNQLWLKSVRAPRLTGQLLPYRGSTYVVRWRDRSFNADAFAAFTLDEQGRASGLKMKPISELTDFSYDFQDLDLKRVETPAPGAVR